MRHNPYVAGPPVRGRNSFYGRQDSLNWVQQELSNPATNTLVLVGQRRIGKTSLLLQLENMLPRDAFLPIYFDLQDQATRPLGMVLSDLADTVVDKLDLMPLDNFQFDDQGRSFQRQFLPHLYKVTPSQVRPVFLFDEYDVLGKLAEEELRETAAAKAFFPFLRRLTREEPRLAFAFVVGRRPEDLSLDFNSLVKGALTREVWVLNRVAATLLIRQGETDGVLKFDETAITRLLELTNGHPYLLQLLCQRLWQSANPQSENFLPLRVDRKEVDAVIPDALAAGENALVWLWDGLAPGEKIYAAALAEITQPEQTIPEDEVINVLTQYAPRLRAREVELAPRDLVKRQVLEEAGHRQYRFAVEMFRLWVQQNRPLQAVKDELDHVDERANRSFQNGLDSFKGREWEVAIEDFYRALKRNPRHFGARLYLGETYLETGQIDEAIVQLEQAYQLDKEEARLPLVRALIQRAKHFGIVSNEDRALIDYDRALELSPNEKTALTDRLAIWEGRGDRALANKHFDIAIEAYQKIGNIEKVAQATNARRQHALQKDVELAENHEANKEWDKVVEAYRRLAEVDPENEKWLREVARIDELKRLAKVEAESKVATQYESRQEWEKAADVYKLLIQLDPDNKIWPEKLLQMEDESCLAKQYARSNEHIQQKEWDKAQQILVEIVSKQATYRDSAEMLVLVLRRGLPPPNPYRLWALGSSAFFMLSILGIVAVWLLGQSQTTSQLEPSVTSILNQTTVPQTTQSASSTNTATIMSIANFWTSTPTIITTSLHTPTSTPTVRPSNTPTLILQVTDTVFAVQETQARVILNSVYLRNGPGTNYDAIHPLTKDEVVQVLAQSEDGLWYNVELDDSTQGWLAATNVEIVSPETEVGDIVVALTIPATPTFIATNSTIPTPTSGNCLQVSARLEPVSPELNGVMLAWSGSGSGRYYYIEITGERDGVCCETVVPREYYADPSRRYGMGPNIFDDKGFPLGTTYYYTIEAYDNNLICTATGSFVR